MISLARLIDVSLSHKSDAIQHVIMSLANNLAKAEVIRVIEVLGPIRGKKTGGWWRKAE
jgi:hypothetical protein